MAAVEGETAVHPAIGELRVAGAGAAAGLGDDRMTVGATGARTGGAAADAGAVGAAAGADAAGADTGARTGGAAGASHGAHAGVAAAFEPRAASEVPGFQRALPDPIVRADGSEIPVAGQLAAVVSYDGTDFAGFAKQPGLVTVQGTLERAFGTALHRPVQTVCAGRTDAGVHARGQVVNLPVTADELTERSLFRLRRSANVLSGDAISIRSLTAMPADFSARFDAYEREYRYFIVPGAVPPVFLRRFAWHVGSDLDVAAMQQAARLLEGEHDFKSFCLAASAKDRNTVRTVHSIDVSPFEMFGERGLCVRVVGNAFLHSMIRAIVGTLAMVGRSKRAPEWVAQVLQARNRQAAGENAPACGLVFWHVTYKDGLPS